MNRNYKIAVNFWEQFLTNLASTYGIFFQLIDSSGNIILNAANERTLCSYLSRFENSCSKCREYCLDLSMKAILEQNIERFNCYMSIECFAVPVNISKNEKGVVLGGKVLTDIPYSEAYSEKCRQLGIDIQEVLNSLHELKFMKEKSIQAYIDIIHNFAGKTALMETNISEYDQKDKQIKKLLKGINEINSCNEIDREFFLCLLKTSSESFAVKDVSLIIRNHDAYNSVADIRDYIDAGSSSGISLKKDSPLVKKVIDSGREPFILEDTVIIGELGIKWGAERITIVPICKTGELWGILLFFNFPKEIAYMENVQFFAENIGNFIEANEMKSQIKLFKQNKSELNAMMEKFSKLSHINELLENVVAEISSFANAGRVSVAILNNDTGKLELMAAKGIDESILKSNRYIDENSISYQVFSSGMPVMVDDISRHETFALLAHSGCRNNSFMSIPLRHNGKALGTLNVSDIEKVILQEDNKYEWLKNRVKLMSLLIEKSILKNEINGLRSEYVDSERGIYSKIYFNEFGKKRIENSRRNKRSDSVIILNIGERLEQFLSHKEDILKQVISGARREIRSSDIMAVYNENSITFFLPDTDKNGALLFAKKMKVKVEDLLLFFEQPGEEIKVGVGVSTFPEDGDSLPNLTLSARRALEN